MPKTVPTIDWLDPGPEASERRLILTSWGLVGVFALLGLFWGLPSAAAVAAAGALAALNVEGLARLVGIVTARSPARGSLLAVLGVGLRYLLLGLALFVILSVWRANVIAVSIGLSVPVAAIFLEWGLSSMREFGSDSDDET
jgi:hypothetical protein